MKGPLQIEIGFPVHIDGMLYQIDDTNVVAINGMLEAAHREQPWSEDGTISLLPVKERDKPRDYANRRDCKPSEIVAAIEAAASHPTLSAEAATLINYVNEANG